MNNYSTTKETMHIWQLFLKYYHLKVKLFKMTIIKKILFCFFFLFMQKEGHEFVNSPACTLSRSFSLDVIGGKPVTVKQV